MYTILKYINTFYLWTFVEIYIINIDIRILMNFMQSSRLSYDKNYIILLNNVH